MADRKARVIVENMKHRRINAKSEGLMDVVLSGGCFRIAAKDRGTGWMVDVWRGEVVVGGGSGGRRGGGCHAQMPLARLWRDPTPSSQKALVY